MKKILTMLLIVAVALVMALPAAGMGKPDKPGKPGETLTYDLTMEFVDGQAGLSTNCLGNEGGVITMSEVGGHQGMLQSLNPVIWIKAPDVEWSRNHPAPVGGVGFDGCHGPSVNPEGPFGPYGGALWITPRADTIKFIWHFDYYLDGEETQRGKKTRLEQTVREHFSMQTTAAYDPETGVVSGQFPFSWYLNENGTLLHPSDPFEPIDGVPMEFKLTITPTN